VLQYKERLKREMEDESEERRRMKSENEDKNEEERKNEPKFESYHFRYSHVVL
jgi:hypothetical protein